MYVPDAFRIDDRTLLFAHAKAHPFATVITHGDDGVAVSHLPLLVDGSKGVLRGHLARENPQLSHLAAGGDALTIFHGPHAYVSPSVYLEHPSVPTWNYVAVHARGPARIVSETDLRAMVDDMVVHFDTTGWRMEAGEDFRRSMLDRIAGFEIRIQHVEGKWKLSQNHPVERQAKVIAALERQGGEDAKEIAALMRERLHGLKLEPGAR